MPIYKWPFIPNIICLQVKIKCCVQDAAAKTAALAVREVTAKDNKCHFLPDPRFTITTVTSVIISNASTLKSHC